MKNEEKVQRLLWLDMEMTGLDPNTCAILEIAAIVTDLDFHCLDQYEAVVFQNQETLDLMDDWCKKTHGQSGLTDKVKNGLPLNKVEKDFIIWVKPYFNDKKIILCGNTIGQDRKFIEKYMPDLEKRLHYRMLDVSSFKILFKNKFNVEFKKKETHRALSDIEESIEELKTYLHHIKV